MPKTPSRWLSNASPVVFTAFASLAGFATYFSMYAFRKPFAAATFDHVPGWHYALDFKNSLKETSWTSICTNAGNGALELLTDRAATAAQRYYRLRQW